MVNLEKESYKAVRPAVARISETKILFGFFQLEI